jgi:hypothetical protein
MIFLCQKIGEAWRQICRNKCFNRNGIAEYQTSGYQFASLLLEYDDGQNIN